MASLKQKISEYINQPRGDDAYKLSNDVNEYARTLVLASRAVGAARGKFTNVRSDLKDQAKRKLSLWQDNDYPFPPEAQAYPELVERVRDGQSPEAEPNPLPSPTDTYVYKPPVQISPTPIVNPILIINVDHYDEGNDTQGVEVLQLHSVPRELKYDPSSNFVGLASIGRNNPHYNYTGSEDSLEFSIDWYCKGLDRAEVIRNCRWVEALSKSNGYQHRPPRVMIKWGNDDFLFGNDFWIVTSAGYTLKDFQDFSKGYDPGTQNPSGVMYSVGKLPQQATQNIVLKRVTNTNRTWKEIRNISNLKDNTLINSDILPEDTLLDNTNPNSQIT
jgi:hypothetical protein